VLITALRSRVEHRCGLADSGSRPTLRWVLTSSSAPQPPQPQTPEPLVGVLALHIVLEHRNSQPWHSKKESGRVDERDTRNVAAAECMTVTRSTLDVCAGCVVATGELRVDRVWVIQQHLNTSTYGRYDCTSRTYLARSTLIVGQFDTGQQHQCTAVVIGQAAVATRCGMRCWCCCPV
jgi:hypothetical protein